MCAIACVPVLGYQVTSINTFVCPLMSNRPHTNVFVLYGESIISIVFYDWQKIRSGDEPKVTTSLVKKNANSLGKK